MLLAAELTHMNCSPYIRGESVRLPVIAVGVCVWGFFINNETELGKRTHLGVDSIIDVERRRWLQWSPHPSALMIKTSLLSGPAGETLTRHFSIFKPLSVVFHTFSLYLCFIIV